MGESARRVHPYIPNAVPAVRAAMLEAVGAASVEEFYADIPASIRLDRPLDLPDAASAPRSSSSATSRGCWTGTAPRAEMLSFLGAGCYPHHVPAVCDEINGRGEFLTAYAGEPYEDHGRFQALFEYESMMAELLEMDVVNVPVYDGFQANATALRMAGRITGRPRVLVPADDLARQARRRSSTTSRRTCASRTWRSTRRRGSSTSARSAGARPSGQTAARGARREPRPTSARWRRRAPEIVRLAHEAGAVAIVVGRPVHARRARAAGGLGRRHRVRRHPAARDAPAVRRRPRRVHRLAPTTRGSSRSTRRASSASRRPRCEGEYGFGDVAYERTSFAVREAGQGVGGDGGRSLGDHGRRLPRAHGPAGDARAGRDDDGPHPVRDESPRGDPRRPASRSRTGTTSRSSSSTSPGAAGRCAEVSLRSSTRGHLLRRRRPARAPRPRASLRSSA